MIARSDTGAGQPVELIMTRMAAALASIRPRRVLRAARKREGSGKCITGCDRDVGLYDERERWVLMKMPRCDTDGVGEVK